MTDFATIKADGSVTTRDPMIRNEGHIWVDPPTGWILKANLKWRDYPVPCQRSDLELLMTRVRPTDCGQN